MISRSLFSKLLPSLRSLPRCSPYFSFISIKTPSKQIQTPPGTGIPTNMGIDHYGIVVPNAQEAADFLMEVFDAQFDWEVKRDPTPTAGERGWDKLFGVNPESHMPHVIMLKCGDQPMTQYLELFEWKSPDQLKPKPWLKMSDIGNSYFSFTVKDLDKVVAHVKSKVIPKHKGVRFIQDPPMSFPLRGEVCNSTFLVSPWGQWIELTCWSKSKDKADVIKQQQQPKINPLIGQHISKLPTPSFLVDLDVVDHNIELMKKRFSEKNMLWRVPCKAHKCPGLSRYILEQGEAVGMVLLTLRECESFAENGFQDIYFANQVASEDEIKRLSLVAKKIKRFRIAVDNLEYLEQVSKAVKSWEITTPIEVLVELNINHNRCGVTVDEVVELCQRVKELEVKEKSVIFSGITGYEGHTPVLPPAEKTKQTFASHNILAEAKRRIEASGLTVGIISAGGSCNYIDCLKASVINEIQAGGGAVCDLLYCEKANLGDHGHKMGAMVLTSIISMPKDNTRAMGNAGFKAVGWHPFGGLPRPRDHSNIKVIGLSAEHTKFEAVEGKSIEGFKRGDKVVLYPGYTDSMGFMHREIYGVRKDSVEFVWKTESDKTWH